ncbi:MAG: V-type ATP synthase subunit B, partial [Microthrixaceae bacterium]
IIGTEELSESDRRFLAFAEAFERRFIGQGEDEDRSIFETLNLAWDLLSMLPPEQLIRVTEEELARTDPGGVVPDDLDAEHEATRRPGTD